MNPTPQQKRFAGAVILMLLFCILVPFFVSGENVNRDSEAITRLSDPDARRRFEQENEIEKIREEERQRLIAEMQEQEKLRNEHQSGKPAATADNSGADDPVIIENNQKADDAEKRQRELVAQRNREKAEAEERRKREQEAKQQAIREQQAKRLEAQRREQELKEKKKAEELASRQNSSRITVINENTKKRNEISVITPNQAEQQRRQNAAAPAQPVSRPGEKYLIRIGVFSSMTNAKNAQSKVGKICKASILPTTSNGQRMLKVVCGPSSDMAGIRTMQAKLSSVVGATSIEKAN